MKAELITIDVRAPKGMIVFFQYNITGVDEKKLNINTWEYAEKFELSVLPRGQLGNIHKGIKLQSKDIAERYLRMNINSWKNKWGDSINVDIISVKTTDRKCFFRVLDDTDLALSRLEKEKFTR